MTDTVCRPDMQDVLNIGVELGRPQSGHWIGTVARRFGLDYDRRVVQDYSLEGRLVNDGGPQRFGRLVGIHPGLVVVDPEGADLVSHRGLLLRGGNLYTTSMFVPESGRHISIMPGLVPTLPRAVAYIKCSGNGQATRLGLSFEQWRSLNRWLDFWLPE